MADDEQVIASGDEQAVNRESARRTRRSFIVGAAATAAGYGAWKLVEAGPAIGRQPRVLRRTFQADAGVGRAVFDERGLAPEYPLSRARALRLNGTVGMDQTLDPASWRLQLVGSSVGKGHPLFVPDVTAWNFRYTGEMQPDRQAFEVKSAPGNTLGNPKDDDGDPEDSKQAPGKSQSKQGTAGGPPKEQQSSPGGKAGQAGAGASRQEPGAGAGSGQPVTDAASVRGGTTQVLPSGPGAPSAEAGLSIAERFDRMRETITGKRYQGTAEAGASASSLDIGTPGLLLSMADLLKLPRAEHVFEFHCIEGWSEICQWAGVRLADLIEAFPPARINGREPRYVYMETPDGNYYGGYDLNAARHPQSLLVTEMAGKPLSQEHGAPLRLFMPIKYGYKNLKRIGLLAYTDTRPDDYWTKLGYDWYAGL